MRILVFSDIHGDKVQLERLLSKEADYYFAAGDLVNWAKGLDQLAPVLEKRREKVLVIPGNHEHESHIAAFCAKHGFEAMHGRTKEVGGGWVLAGLGHSSPTPFDTPGEYSEETFREKLAPFAKLDPARTLLVCHCPPYGTPLDEAAPARHIGSRAIAEHLAAHPPAWFFCGHVHEAWGRKINIGPTQAVNTGKHGYMLEL